MAQLIEHCPGYSAQCISGRANGSHCFSTIADDSMAGGNYCYSFPILLYNAYVPVVHLLLWMMSDITSEG